jgi:hypothetical protein
VVRQGEQGGEWTVIGPVERLSRVGHSNMVSPDPTPMLRNFSHCP